MYEILIIQISSQQTIPTPTKTFEIIISVKVYMCQN